MGWGGWVFEGAALFLWPRVSYCSLSQRDGSLGIHCAFILRFVTLSGVDEAVQITLSAEPTHADQKQECELGKSHNSLLQ